MQGGIAGAGESTAASAVGSNILNLETARPESGANETTGADAAKASPGAGLMLDSNRGVRRFKQKVTVCYTFAPFRLPKGRERVTPRTGPVEMPVEASLILGKVQKVSPTPLNRGGSVATILVHNLKDKRLYPLWPLWIVRVNESTFGPGKKVPAGWPGLPP